MCPLPLERLATLPAPRLEVPDIEFVVLGPELGRYAPALLEQLPSLRIVQTTQAGVETLLPLVPDAVVVCSATGQSFDMSSNTRVGI